MLLPGGHADSRSAGEATAFCAFSPARDQFALAGSDGRVRLLDTGSGRLLQQLGDATPAIAVDAAGSSQQVAQRCTALAWRPAAAAKARAPKRKATSTAAGEAVLVGTHDGSVCCWDAAAAELRWRSPSCHTSAVVSIACAPSARLLYSAAADGIAEVDAASGEVQQRWTAGPHPVTCIALSPDGLTLLVASAGGTMAVWDATSRRRVRKLAGHSSAGAGARCLAFSPSGECAVSAAAGDRAVAVWDIAAATSAAGSKSSSPAAAVGRVSLPEGIPLQLSTSASVGDDDAFDLCAVSEDGVAFFWCCARGGLPQSDVRRLHIGTSAQGNALNRECILAVVVETGLTAGAGSIFIARGSVARASFERVALGAGDVILKPAAKGALLDAPGSAKAARAAAAAAAAAAATATVHGADNACDAALPRPAANGASRKHVAALSNGDAAHAAAPATEHARVAVAGEQTLGERLRALEIAAGEHGGDDAAAPAAPSAFDGDVPRADSLAVLLAQALASNDTALLERVLSVSDRKVAANTVARLRPEQALAFLAAAVSRLQTSPARGARLAHWIRETLAAHAGYLTAAPGASQLLAALYGILDARLSLYRPLLALSGRLDLLLAAQRRSQGASSGAAVGGAQVEYEEPEDGEPEDVRGALGSDDDSDSDEDDDAPGEDGSDGMGDLGEENDSDDWHTDEDAP